MLPGDAIAHKVLSSPIFCSDTRGTTAQGTGEARLRVSVYKMYKNVEDPSDASRKPRVDCARRGVIR